MMKILPLLFIFFFVLATPFSFAEAPSESTTNILTLLHNIDKQTAVTSSKVVNIEKRIEEMRKDVLDQYVTLEKRVSDLEKFQWRYAGAVAVLVALLGWIGPMITISRLKELEKRDA